METSALLATIASLHGEARDLGLYFQSATDESLRGRTVTVGGRPVISFASCSYLGLERHPALLAGARAALDRFGTQFSASRGYLSAPLYAPLEASLSTLFGGHALVTPSTTLGHQIVLGALVTERDALVLDHQVHHSVQAAATLARAAGAHVELVRHDALDRAEAVVGALARTRDTVWFACDGVFSMFGDLAPVGLLDRLLDVAPNVRLYVDDAHGMSWAGHHGRGSFLSRFPLSPRVVVGTSLNKAFAAGGGCFVFADAAERERVQLCGAPFVFSGPLQPPMLGAALASATLHQTPAIAALQRALARVVGHLHARLGAVGLAPLVASGAPIVFLPLGLPRVAWRVARALFEEGFYVPVSMFPAVPMKRAGLRLTVTADHDLADLDRLVEALARHIPAAQAAEGFDAAQCALSFEGAIPAESATPAPAGPGSLAAPRVAAVTAPDPALHVEVATHVASLDRALWDRLLGPVGAVSTEALAVQERVFRGPRPEHDWRPHYVLVRRPDGAPVAATVLTTCLVKDDMLDREAVSRAVEARRAADPYALTSRAVVMGSLLSEGEHLWLDRSGPWEAAVRAITRAAGAIQAQDGASVVILRDLAAGDAPLDATLRGEGYVVVPTLDRHLVTLDADETPALQKLLGRLGKRARQHVRGLLDDAPAWTVRVVPSDAPAALCDALFARYQTVARRKYKINTFELPRTILPAVLSSAAWEVVTLAHSPDPAAPPAAWWAAHVHGDAYAPFFCGLDYDAVYTHGAYRQMLLQILQRALVRGARTVHLGMDADQEKQRFGSVAIPSVAYVQAQDHFQGEVLREIAAEVALHTAVRPSAR